MANGTVLVASPRAMGSTPVASGSSVPACPAFAAPNRCFDLGHGLRSRSAHSACRARASHEWVIPSAARHSSASLSRRGRARPSGEASSSSMAGHSRRRCRSEAQLRHESEVHTRRELARAGSAYACRGARRLPPRLRRRAAARTRWRASGPASADFETVSECGSARRRRSRRGRRCRQAHAASARRPAIGAGSEPCACGASSPLSRSAMQGVTASLTACA